MKTLETRLAAGVPWLIAAAISAELGWLQMTQPVVCGLHDGPGHCAACYAAVALAIMGLAMVVRTPKPARIPHPTSA